MALNWSGINWLAVATAAIATFFLGAIWYTAFAKPWVAYHGYTPEQVERMKKLRPPAVFFGGMLISYVIMAAVVGVLFATFGVRSINAGVTIAFLLWLGIALPIGITSWIASEKHFGAYVIDLGYQLVFLLMTGAIVGAWRHASAV